MRVGYLEEQGPKYRQCEHCGLYFHNQGHSGHERNCPWSDVDWSIQDLRREDVVDEDTDGVAEEDYPDPDDVVTSTPEEKGPGSAIETRSPSTVTDGGDTGLGLEGPPEPAPPSTDVDDQDDQNVDEPECCSDPARRALEPGTKIDLDDGTRVKADPGDELCNSCGALVEADGEVRY